MNKDNKYKSIRILSPRFQRIWKIAQVDFQKRYYNSKIGLLWALINPISQIALYYFVFTQIFQRGEENYVLYLFSALVIWLAFSQATSLGMTLLKKKTYLIESVQFDWLDLYTSHMISVLLGLLFNICAYLILLVLTGASIGAQFYMFPFILLTWYLLTAGVSIILGIIYPSLEDIAHIWPLLVMIGFWVSGIFFTGTFYLDNYQWFIYLNPFIGILLNVRACLLEGNSFFFNLFVINLLYAIIIYVVAVVLFRKFAKKSMEEL